MQVPVIDAPGGTGELYQCPTCSRSYLMQDPENGAQLPPPQICKRCGSPMDIEAAKKYGDQLAEQALVQIGPGGARRTVKV